MDVDRAALEFSARVGALTMVIADARMGWPLDGPPDIVLDFSSFDDTGNPMACYGHAATALRTGGHLLSSFANGDVVSEEQARAGGYVASRPVDLLRELSKLGMRVDRLWNETGARAVIMATKLDLPKNPPVEVVRRAWVRASQFPGDKEAAYLRGPRGETGHTDAQEFEAQRGKRVLEYGCGGGSDTLSYLRRGCDVTYVDITPENVDTTRAYAAREGYAARSKGIVLEESDRIPLPSGIFEVANAHGVLHHIPRADLVLWELRRLLKPGGLLFAMFYTEHLEARYAEQIEKTMEAAGVSREEAMCWCFDGHGSPWARTYTSEQGEALLNEHGFKLLEVREYNASAINGKPDFRTFKAVAT
jgi:SAM-dependent methyltransferase